MNYTQKSVVTINALIHAHSTIVLLKKNKENLESFYFILMRSRNDQKVLKMMSLGNYLKINIIHKLSCFFNGKNEFEIQQNHTTAIF